LSQSIDKFIFKSRELNIKSDKNKMPNDALLYQMNRSDNISPKSNLAVSSNTFHKRSNNSIFESNDVNPLCSYDNNTDRE